MQEQDVKVGMKVKTTAGLGTIEDIHKGRKQRLLYSVLLDEPDQEMRDMGCERLSCHADEFEPA